MKSRAAMLVASLVLSLGLGVVALRVVTPLPVQPERPASVPEVRGAGAARHLTNDLAEHRPMTGAPRRAREPDAVLGAAWRLFERVLPPGGSRKPRTPESLAMARMVRKHLTSLGILKRAQWQLQAGSARLSVQLAPAHAEVSVAWSRAGGSRAATPLPERSPLVGK